SNTCRQILERFGSTIHPRIAGNVVLACVLQDEVLSNPSQLLSVARVAAPWWYFGTWIQGAAPYRGGQYDEAIHGSEDQADVFRQRAFEWCFLAMAHHRLGHAADAQRCRDQAARWIDEANCSARNDASGARPSWGDWQEPVLFRRLLREVDDLLRSPAAAPP